MLSHYYSLTGLCFSFEMGSTAAPRSTAIRGPRRALNVAVNWTLTPKEQK